MSRTHGPGMPWHEARAAARALGARAARSPRVGRWVREVPLADALGGTLAAELVARIALPPFDASAMDGYAVSGEGPWTVVARQLAGQDAADAPLEAGQAAEIATGALVPKGTSAVLPYEAAERSGDTVRGEAAPGRHVRWTGEDVECGSAVVPAGRAVTPAVLGLAASLAHDTLPVVRPEVLPLVTGDELGESGIPAPGRVRDAIGPLLPGVVAWAGGAARPAQRVADDRAAMLSAVDSARGGQPGPDGAGQAPPAVIAVCGASSAGPADHLRSVLAELGARTVVDGVECRPGHPQLLAHFGSEDVPGPVVVGLPGNPFAALVAAVTLLVPVLAALTGRPDPALRGSRIAPLCQGEGGRAAPHHRDTRLVAVRVEDGQAVPVGHDRPGSLHGAALADALAIVPPGWRGPDAELLLLPG